MQKVNRRVYEIENCTFERIEIRDAVMKDWKILLDWRNDPVTRANSFSSDIISEDVHKIWLRKALKGGQNSDRQTKIRYLFIVQGLKNGVLIPFAQLRFDKEGKQNLVEISITLSPEYRGKHLSTLVIKKGLEFFLSNIQKDTKIILARIKPENIYSQKAFLHAGFMKDGNEMIEGSAGGKKVDVPCTRYYYNYNHA